MNDTQKKHLMELAKNVSEGGMTACFAVMLTTPEYGADKRQTSNVSAMGRFTLGQIFRQVAVLGLMSGKAGLLIAKKAIMKDETLTSESINERVEQSGENLKLKNAENALRFMKKIEMGYDDLSKGLPLDLDQSVADELRQRKLPLLADVISHKPEPVAV